MSVSSFPVEVIEKLQCYVYRLIDPRSGETFYVGRGKGNRVFDHARGAWAGSSDESDPKLSRILDILADGFAVQHVIHRHELDEQTAKEVEAALIDAYPGLSNHLRGIDAERGVMHVDTIIRKYAAPAADLTDRVLVLDVSKSFRDHPIYDAARFAWGVHPDRARMADFVLAIGNGLIREVFVVDAWLPATRENFPTASADIPHKYGFVGRPADDSIRERYRMKRLPDGFRKRGTMGHQYNYDWRGNLKVSGAGSEVEEIDQ